MNNESSFAEDNEIFENSTFIENFESSFHTCGTETTSKGALNISALCCDEEINGFDKLSGKTWIYPTNFPVRNYQFNIINATILKNTLVSLPTGLGKTFIAAVIMYNFYRWYPLGKIVFTAPTRPLVAQQIEACYSIVAIPPDDTIEMTGSMQVNVRQTHWKNKRVFFATPQVVYNDIQSGICPGDKIRCLVFDEAHRARGNYAYCQIVSSLSDRGHKIFRILALSATPGSKVDDVINVVKNLHIAHLELRTDNCLDVAPYSHSRKINTVIIQLGPELTQLRQQYIQILDGYARRLKQLNILPHNVGNLSKGRIVMLFKEFQTKERGARHPQHNHIMKDFTFLISLYHGLELLLKHGSRVFLNFFDEHPEKSWIQSDDKLIAMLERLRDDMGINPLSLNRSVLPDGSYPDVPKNLVFGHPKFDKLREIMVKHFNECKEKKKDTRAIVFCEYRESVNLVHCLLLQCRPDIKPQMFVGQGASGKEGKAVVSQKQQMRVMRSFRDGIYNTLVATCVAEEGLDVGSVDLIICFDISNSSPIRLVQRCGRTGRERSGQVYILVTEGREHQTLLDCMRQRDGLTKKVLQSKEIETIMYKLNPRMIPHNFIPQCQKMFITVEKKINVEVNKKKGQKDLRSMLTACKSTSSSPKITSQNITEEEFKRHFPEGFDVTPYFPEFKEYWNIDKEKIMAFLKDDCSERKHSQEWLEWQRTLHAPVNIGHSSDSHMFCDLLQYADAKRFELPPSSQNPIFSTQYVTTNVQKQKIQPIKKSKKSNATKSPLKKDGDIRALFSTTTKSMKNYTKVISELNIAKDDSISTALIDLLVDLSVCNSNIPKCLICENIYDCQIFGEMKTKHTEAISIKAFLKESIYPDLNLLDELNPVSIKQSILAKKQIKPLTNCNTNVANDNSRLKNFDLHLLNSPENNSTKNNIEYDKSKNFDLGDIDEIFADNDDEFVSKVIITENPSTPKQTLEFFGLDSIDDIFADSNDSHISEKSSNSLDKDNSEKNTLNSDINVSPSILSGSNKLQNLHTSPIICTQSDRLKQNKTNLKSSLLSLDEKPKSLKPKSLFGNKEKDISPQKNLSEILNVSNANNSKNMFTITQLVNLINESKNESNILNISNDSGMNRSSSPILLTQSDRANQTKKKSDTSDQIHSLIILESDSESDTLSYSLENNVKNTCDINVNKRKLDTTDESFSIGSPYFPKKPKLSDENISTSLQDKLRKVLSLRKPNDSFVNINVKNQQKKLPVTEFSKENAKPNCVLKSVDVANNQEVSLLAKTDPLQRLQKYRLSCSNRKPITAINNSTTTNSNSDSDFTDDIRNEQKKNCSYNIAKHKVKKKRKKASSFIDMEAELSNNSEDTGDEMTDESVGSIIDFICDEEVPNEEDIQARYLESVKSPMRPGVFKIPAAPNNFDDVFSQTINDDVDHYEMDSFCVTSQMGLTQVEEDTDLDLAEKRLEIKRRAKKKKYKRKDRDVSKSAIDSPVIRRPIKALRRIDSDSE